MKRNNQLKNNSERQIRNKNWQKKINQNTKQELKTNRTEPKGLNVAALKGCFESHR